MPLEGTLDELPLSDMIEMTSLGNKSGLLVVADTLGSTVGSLGFNNGRLVSASCGALRGESAGPGQGAVFTLALPAVPAPTETISFEPGGAR